MAKKKQVKPSADEILSVVDDAAKDATISRKDRDLTRLRSENKYLLGEIEQLEERVNFIDQIAVPPKALRWNELAKKKSTQATAIVLLSDWHIGEAVDYEQSNGLNEYNPKIAERRAKRIFQKIPEYIERYVPMAKVLYLAVIGDIITGFIHEELMRTNHLSPVEEVLLGKDLLASGIDYLLKNGVKEIVIPTAHGNHGRTTQKSQFKDSYKVSYEWMMYQDLARIYQRDPRVHWVIAKGYHNHISIYDRMCRFHHGDAHKYQGGIGGLTVPVKRDLAKWNKSPLAASCDFFGHWHTTHFDKSFISNGSLIGYGEYSVRIKGEYEPPSQQFIAFSKNRGRHLVTEIFADEENPITEGVVYRGEASAKGVRKGRSSGPAGEQFRASW